MAPSGGQMQVTESISGSVVPLAMLYSFTSLNSGNPALNSGKVWKPIKMVKFDGQHILHPIDQNKTSGKYLFCFLKYYSCKIAWKKFHIQGPWRCVLWVCAHWPCTWSFWLGQLIPHDVSQVKCLSESTTTTATIWPMKTNKTCMKVISFWILSWLYQMQ